jgi:S1-C subfamily serine protease
MRDMPNPSTIEGMETFTLTDFSDQVAALVERAAPSVVQVHGRRRPVSGVAYAADIVITNARALGRSDAVRVTRADGQSADGELAGWDPATGLAVIRVGGLELTPAPPATTLPRPGHLTIAVARSWSNAATASTGVVAVVGGPLRTGHGRQIDQIIRVTAPIHGGFAGGALLDSSGHLMGVGTAAEIRGFAVVIPATIAWHSVAYILEHGRPRTGFLGISGQTVRLPERQRAASGRERALLVVDIHAGGPADESGIMTGDLLLDVDGQALGSTDDLLALLQGERIGRAVPVRILRGDSVANVTVTVGTRNAR